MLNVLSEEQSITSQGNIQAPLQLAKVMIQRRLQCILYVEISRDLSRV